MASRSRSSATDKTNAEEGDGSVERNEVCGFVFMRAKLSGLVPTKQLINRAVRLPGSIEVPSGCRRLATGSVSHWYCEQVTALNDRNSNLPQFVDGGFCSVRLKTEA